MPSVSDQQWERAAAIMRARRIELRLTQLQVAIASNTSESTVRSLETAKRDAYHPSTLRAISSALGWEPDAIHRLVEGGNPIPAHTPEDRATRLEAELLEARAALARQSGYDVNFDDPTERDLWALTRLPEKTRWELIEHVREEKRRDGLISQRDKA